MASDYTAIKNDNVKRYGTDIGRIGPMLPEEALIVRIQDPAGKAWTFAFDSRWLSVAEVSDPTETDRQQPEEGQL